MKEIFFDTQFPPKEIFFSKPHRTQFFGQLTGTPGTQTQIFSEPLQMLSIIAEHGISTRHLSGTGKHRPAQAPSAMTVDRR